jgi:choline dehydrogenase
MFIWTMRAYFEGWFLLKVAAATIINTPEDTSRRRRRFQMSLEPGSASTESLLEKAPLEADFVIVGAGTAGSLLADRLSTIGSVLILECGSGVPTSIRSRIPGAGCTYDQLSETTCGERCSREMAHIEGSGGSNAGLDFRMGPGGTSVIAVGTHFRGGDTYWRNLANSHGKHWLLSEDEFSKLEDEMSVRQAPDVVDKDHLLFAQALLQHVSLISQNSSARTIGSSSVFPRYQDESGWYTNSYTQFLKRAIVKDNVRMITNACARRFIKSSDDSAPSLEVKHKNKRIRASARREVILAAGALGSPALLQRSGILTARVRDQPDIRVAWRCGKCSYRDDFVQALHSFFRQHNAKSPTGALALPGYDSGAVVDLHGGVPALILASTELATAEGIVPPAAVGRDDSKSIFEVHIVLLQPHSFEGKVSKSGKLVLKKMLTNSKDLDAAVHGIQLVRKVVKAHMELNKLGLGREVHPGPEYHTDNDLRSLLQSEGSETIQSFQSATASCRVGQVVDDQMHVVGMPLVRVADASVLPQPPLGRTLFSTLVVAQVASKLIMNKTF